MENLVPLGTGNSRLMKSNIPASTTLAQLIQMWNNGTFPYDIGPLNSAGISQQGTPLNKSTLLKDATAALFGLGASAVPDDMFNILAHAGDLHVWKRTQNGQVDYPVSPNRNAYQEGSDAQPAGYTLGEVQNGQFDLIANSSGLVYQYGDLSVSNDGTVSLVSAKNLSVFPSSTVADLSVIKGKFIQTISAGTGVVYGYFPFKTIFYIPEDAEIVRDSGGSFVKPYVTKCQTVAGYAAIPANNTIEYIGQLGDKVRIASGSYVGTGTYGSSNPNTLTFGFEPKIVIISGYSEGDASKYQGIGFFVRGTKFSSGSATAAVWQNATYPNSQNSANAVTWNGNEMSWYTTVNSMLATSQFNAANSTYTYIAIG